MEIVQKKGANWSAPGKAKHLIFRIALLIPLLGTLGLSIGGFEIGPTVWIVLPSGLHAEFDTWVRTLESDESRFYQAVSSEANMDCSDEELKRDLVDARRQLNTEIVRMKATSMLIGFLTEETNDLAAFSCYYASQSATPKCFRN